MKVDEAMVEAIRLLMEEVVMGAGDMEPRDAGCRG
jgi:hypothetical protein